MRLVLHLRGHGASGMKQAVLAGACGIGATAPRGASMFIKKKKKAIHAFYMERKYLVRYRLSGTNRPFAKKKTRERLPPMLSGGENEARSVLVMRNFDLSPTPALGGGRYFWPLGTPIWLNTQCCKGENRVKIGCYHNLKVRHAKVFPVYG